MPSSTSSSDVAPPSQYSAVRLTASDRPGVAQPVPVRDIPAQPWGGIIIIALVLTLLLVAGWEWHWRDFGATPSYQNSDGQWARQRRRIDHGEGDATVIIGSSRVLFDIQLPVWERWSGRRPIQLALEGTSPIPVLEDLAADPAFHGRLVIGVTPFLFFTGFAYRGGVIKYFHKESPSQRVGQWLSMHLLEPYFAFDDPDFALVTVLKRQAWPIRTGTHPRIDVRKLSVSDADRNTRMWSKVIDDPEYQAMARTIWTQSFRPPPNAPPPAEAQRILDKQIERAAAAITKLRARGVEVTFVRAPSAGPFLDFENHAFPRARTWDVLLTRTGAPGIHFEDYPELRGLTLPEWSHLLPADAERFTASLYGIFARRTAAK